MRDEEAEARHRVHRRPRCVGHGTGAYQLEGAPVWAELEVVLGVQQLPLLSGVLLLKSGVAGLGYPTGAEKQRAEFARVVCVFRWKTQAFYYAGIHQ